MKEALAIVERSFGCRRGELFLGNVNIAQIAAEVATPFFVYDRGVMEEHLRRLRGALPERFEIYYSIKANPNQAILKTFLSQRCGLKVASGGEFYQALSAGCDPRKILFAGPGKTPSELEYAVSMGVGEIHVESLDEIDTLVELARRIRTRVCVAVRVNPGQEAQGGAMRMGGKPAPFGVDEECLDVVLDRIMAERLLRFHGVHLFVGTQILDYEVLGRQYRKGLEIAISAAQRTGLPLSTVDFGGGLGIPYYTGDKQLDVEAFGGVVAELLEQQGSRPELKKTRFIVEPGRYLVGEAGIYVSRVTSVKQSRGKSFVVVDGGMHHHLAASGNLGQVIKRNFPVAILNKLDNPISGQADVVGPLCTPLDVLGRNVDLPDVKVGDLVGVFQSGAYARSASPLGFLSHPSPCEVLIADGAVNIIRRRGSYRDLLEDQSGLPEVISRSTEP